MKDPKWHTSHRPDPIDEYGDPALMCLRCLACACCEPERAHAECAGEADGVYFIDVSYPAGTVQAHG